MSLHLFPRSSAHVLNVLACSTGAHGAHIIRLELPVDGADLGRVTVDDDGTATVAVRQPRANRGGVMHFVVLFYRGRRGAGSWRETRVFVESGLVVAVHGGV